MTKQTITKELAEELQSALSLYDDDKVDLIQAITSNELPSAGYELLTNLARYTAVELIVNGYNVEPTKEDRARALLNKYKTQRSCDWSNGEYSSAGAIVTVLEEMLEILEIKL